MRFADKVLMVTGAGAGLGRAAAHRLASEGARLALIDVDLQGLEESERSVLAATPGAELLTVTADVSRDADVAPASRVARLQPRTTTPRCSTASSTST